MAQRPKRLHTTRGGRWGGTRGSCSCSPDCCRRGGQTGSGEHSCSTTRHAIRACCPSSGPWDPPQETCCSSRRHTNPRTTPTRYLPCPALRTSSHPKGTSQQRRSDHRALCFRHCSTSSHPTRFPKGTCPPPHHALTTPTQPPWAMIARTCRSNPPHHSSSHTLPDDRRPDRYLTGTPFPSHHSTSVTARSSPRTCSAKNPS